MKTKDTYMYTNEECILLFKKLQLQDICFDYKVIKIIIDLCFNGFTNVPYS